MPRLLFTIAIVFSLVVTFAGARRATAQQPATEEPAAPPQAVPAEEAGPCITDPTKKPLSVEPDPNEQPPGTLGPLPEIDVEKQPWMVETARLPINHPALKREKTIWAKSFLWAEAPQLEVEEWITQEPNMKGKFVLIECWATWCPPCRRSLKLLNYYHEKYGDELCVIAVNETDRKALEEMIDPTPLKDIKFHLAVDTKRRFADALGVFGIPHAVIIEPQYGCVIWEGMPTQPGHELNEKIIERILEIGRKAKAEQEAAEKKE